MVLESPFGWAAKKCVSVTISIWRAHLIRFTSPSSFPSLSSSHPLLHRRVFPRNGRWCDRVAGCTQFIANRASPLSRDSLSCFRVCVTRHKAGRSALDVVYSAKCPAIRHCASFFWSMLSLLSLFSRRSWIFPR